MNRPAQFPEVVPSLDLKDVAFSTPTTNLKVDLEQPISDSRAQFQFEWDDFDTGTLDELR